MKLRKWQAECIDLAIKEYISGKKHFLALATPGAGKTIMAAELSRKMFEKGLIDLVLCFSPSSLVSFDFCNSLEQVIGERFNGLLGSKGQSLTYQSMQYLNEDFWKLFDNYQVLVIFDEIHHCSGSNIENANAWGEQIILKIQETAAFTIALTGTPWRSDKAPIVLSEYTSCSNKIKCDYIYGLSEAIRDNVCRIPKIIAIDNDNVSVIENEESTKYSSFEELLSHSSLSYSDVILNEQLIIHLFEQANLELTKLRLNDPTAGGLVVAGSVAHAKQISKLIAEKFSETATIVTYQEEEPTKLIQRFRDCKSKWIISVGMISEGTNIPRLQVCCHLTNIKTEMHFRQILGRVLRQTSDKKQQAFLYMPAHPQLVEYAYRVAHDIPDEANIVKIKSIKTRLKEKVKAREYTTPTAEQIFFLDRNFDLHEDKHSSSRYNQTANVNLDERSPLSSAYEKMVGIFGKFKEETLDIDLLPVNR